MNGSSYTVDAMQAELAERAYRQRMAQPKGQHADFYGPGGNKLYGKVVGQHPEHVTFHHEGVHYRQRKVDV